ncbi:MAG: hypothetical protein ABFS35_17655 [Bacteroidota bacterium]
MHLDTLKIELINWISMLNDQQTINKVVSLKKEFNKQGTKDTKIFGSGKHLIEFIAEDFNKPIDSFKEYQK